MSTKSCVEFVDFDWSNLTATERNEINPGSDQRRYSMPEVDVIVQEKIAVFLQEMLKNYTANYYVFEANKFKEVFKQAIISAFEMSQKIELKPGETFSDLYLNSEEDFMQCFLSTYEAL